MALILYKLAVFLIICSLAKCAERNLPSYIESCKENDPDLNKCIVENANKAIPHLKHGDKKFKIISFDPLKINEVIIQSGTNLKLSMKNIDFIGLSDSTITEAKAQLKDNKLQLKLFAPTISIVGDYEIDGKIVILPITGQGKANITTSDVSVNVDITLKVEEKNGIRQVALDSIVVEYTMQRGHYDFGNLFNGNVRLASEMQKFMDENWRDIDKEFHGDMCLLMAEIIQTGTSQILKDVPYEKIFLP